MSGGGDQFLKKEHVQQLPSKKAYDAFDHTQNGYNECTTYGVNVGDAASRLSNALNTHQNIKNEAEKIVKAWCYASSQAGSGWSPSYTGLCLCFYYWLGGIVWNKGKSVSSVTTFLSLMGDIYTALHEFKVPNNCTLFYKENSEITDDLFQKRRTVFDFSFDYKNIKQQLQLHNHSCDQDYYNHLNQAKTAFKEVLDDCEGKIDLYCTEFKNTFETKNNNNNSQNPLILKHGKIQESGTTQVYKDVQLELKYAPPKTNTAMTATISSIFSIGALGFAASLLYKYNLLPSWFGNYSGGGGRKNSLRRKRGATAVDSDFDTITTETSTIGSTTIADPSEYSIPPSNRGRGRETNRTRAGKHILHQVAGQIYVIIPR